VVLRRGGGRRKYSCNEDFFETINTEEKSYWLGFLAADGCISNNRSDMSMSQSIKDINTVEKFREALEITNPMRHRFQKLNGKIFEKARLSIRSKNLCKDLINKGVVPRKTLILKPPKNIPDSLIHHWIRGYFDGDGSIFFIKVKNRKYKKVSIVGTLEVMKFIQKKFNGSGYIYDMRPRARVHRFRVNRQEDIKRFGLFIYKDATVFLKRKKLIFQGVF